MIFIHDYLNSFENLKEGLPRKDLDNTLTNRVISDTSYEQDINVWKAFKMNTIKDYHDFYLKVDVLLSACVWNY